MNDYEVYEIILKQVCKEISDIAESIDKNGNVSEQELKRLDILYHLKKDLLATWGMEHPEEYYEGNSGMRGRSPSTGRYVSRDTSYTEGYSKGYSEAMNQANNNSGHYPMQNPYYPDNRRW